LPAKRIADIRQDYLKAALDEASAGDDPLVFFHHWFNEAQAAGISEVNAMTLATVNAHGKPHARIVLLKGLDETGFVFYTNYLSAKGGDLAQSRDAALVFFWKELERQVRIEGYAEKVSAEESDAYFNSRPAGSRLGAWSSPQSRVIESRNVIEENLAKYSQQFDGAIIPRPEHWGGLQDSAATNRILAGAQQQAARSYSF
jgi:pyridoxamine 5'-phosphate oxidase